MKIVYIFSNRQNAVSIEKKANKFCHLLRDYGIHADIYNVSNYNLLKLLKLIKLLNRTDCIYVRDNFNPFCMIIAFLYSKKCVLECNRPLFYLHGSKSSIFQYVRNILNKVMYFRLRKFNCVTNEILESVKQGVPDDAQVISLGNVHGYLGREYTFPTPREEKEFDFAFLGDLTQPWQGRERIFQCLRQNKDYRLLIIGRLVKIPSDIFDQVVQIGIIEDAAEILKQLGRAKTGLSAMAMSKRRQKYISALKHADYVAAGLPIISSAEDSFLINKYTYQVLSDDAELAPLEIINETVQMKQIEVRNSAEQMFIGFVSWLQR